MSMMATTGGGSSLLTTLSPSSSSSGTTSTKSVSRNIELMQKQASTAIHGSSLFVKLLCILVCVGYAASFSDRAMFWFCVLPGNVLPPNCWIWTCFTHSFIEVHFWIVFCDIIVAYLYSKLLEPLWGGLEMLFFYAVITLTVAVLTTLTYLVVYLISQNTDFLFDNYIHGLAGYLAGFSVAVKQVMPDHVLISSPFGKLRNKHIPLWLLYLAIIVRLLGGVDAPFPIMFAWGLVVSWVYLRFYQKHSSGSRGDMADNFSFATFFPNAVQPFIVILSNTVYSVLLKVKICRKPQRKYDIGAPTTITVTLPGSDGQDAERRRLLALKALNDRLNANSPSNWPSMDENSEKDSSPTLSPGVDNRSTSPDVKVSSVVVSSNLLSDSGVSFEENKS